MNSLIAGVAKNDITLEDSVSMDGMVRAHLSDGVTDPLYARALVMSNSGDISKAFAVVSMDLGAMTVRMV